MQLDYYSSALVHSYIFVEQLHGRIKNLAVKMRTVIDMIVVITINYHAMLRCYYLQHCLLSCFECKIVEKPMLFISYKTASRYSDDYFKISSNEVNMYM